MTEQVTQADRDRAKPFHDEVCNAFGPTPMACSCGAHQAFASHRIAAEQSKAEQIAELVEVLEELAQLMDDVVDGNYTPDTFTTQPARKALAKHGATNDT